MFDYYSLEAHEGAKGALRMDDWAEVVHQYRPLVRWVACRLLGNGADVADCAQEVFLSAMRSYQPQEVRNWPGLLRRLTTCRALDMLRQRLSYAESVRDWAGGARAVQPVPDPAQSAEDHELVTRLRQALAQLAPQQAEVFYLVCVEEMDHDEVARQLQLTPGNVRILLHRARMRLRELLAESPEPKQK